MNIADMKVGDRLFLGKYKVASQDGSGLPISWLKATREGTFLSEYVLDYIIYDAIEPLNTNVYCRAYGNSDYNLSNLYQFLNSAEVDWYCYSHDSDAPPGPENHRINGSHFYRKHSGFLCGFAEHEIESLASAVDLPSVSDILGGRRFELFNRKGVRPKATSDMIGNRSGQNFWVDSFVEFWTSDCDSESSVCIIGRDARMCHAPASTARGVRPKCRVKPEINVEFNDSLGGYVIVPFTVQSDDNVCSVEDILGFLGLP